MITIIFQGYTFFIGARLDIPNRPILLHPSFGNASIGIDASNEGGPNRKNANFPYSIYLIGVILLNATAKANFALFLIFSRIF